MIPRISRSKAVVVTAACLLAACGGGGGESTVTTENTQGTGATAEVAENSFQNPDTAVGAAVMRGQFNCGGPAVIGFHNRVISGGNSNEEIDHGRHKLHVKRGVVPEGSRFQAWLIPDRYNRAAVHVVGSPAGLVTNPPADGSKRFRIRIAFGPCRGAVPDRVIRLDDGEVIPLDTVVAGDYVVFSTDRFSTYIVASPDLTGR